MFNTIGSNTRAAVLEYSQVFRFDQILNYGGMTSLIIPSNLYRVLLLTEAAAAAWPFKQQLLEHNRPYHRQQPSSKLCGRANSQWWPVERKPRSDKSERKSPICYFRERIHTLYCP